MSLRFSRLRRLPAFLLLSAVAYLGVCIFVYAYQGRIIFLPDHNEFATPADFECAFEEVRIGPNRLHGYWLPGGPQALIFNHGQGGNVSNTLGRACRLNTFGFSVLTFDPRGYGRSEGDHPSERTVYEDSDAAWNYVTQRKGVAPNNVVLYGFSLGAAVAIESAIRHPDAGGLIAESGFTSIYAMGSLNPFFRWLPLSLIINQKMDSIQKAPHLRMPSLFIHGTADPIVPVSMTEELYAAAAEPKRLFIAPGAGHGDIPLVAGEDYERVIVDFARSLGP